MSTTTTKPYTQTKRWKALCYTYTGVAYAAYGIEKIREHKNAIVATALVTAVAVAAVSNKANSQDNPAK